MLPSLFSFFHGGFSLVWLDCPSVSFFFAQLFGLLRIVGRKHSKVGSYVGKNCPYRPVFLFLFPLAHCSLGIYQSLLMSREGEVRSSELETGLSSFEDHGILEVTSPSTPHRAWGICCSLREKAKKRIRDRFQFLSYVKIRILDGDDRACHSYANFADGPCFLVYPFIRELFFLLQLAPTQVVPNSWRIVVGCMVMWMFANDGDTIRIDEFLHFYCLQKSKDLGY